jgi:hypothetical protein
MSNPSFPVAEQIQLQYSEFEDRLILVAHLKEASVKLLMTRRLGLPLLAQLYKLMPAETELTLPVEPAAPHEATESPIEHSPDPVSVKQNTDPLYLATKVDIQQKPEGYVLAFTGLSLPDAMFQAQPHQPVFAIPFNTTKLSQFSGLLAQQIRHANWQNAENELGLLETSDSRVLH